VIRNIFEQENVVNQFTKNKRTAVYQFVKKKKSHEEKCPRTEKAQRTKKVHEQEKP
jgi:hypothetical protein